MLACRVVAADSWCRRCGCEGTARDTVTRQLAHEPLGWRPIPAGSCTHRPTIHLRLPADWPWAALDNLLTALRRLAGPGR